MLWKNNDQELLLAFNSCCNAFIIFFPLGWFQYIYIIAGEEVTVFVKDLIKFLFTKQQSNRLSRFFYTWGKFYQSLNKKTEIEPYWLEQAIISTPTWWDSTTKYKRILRSYLARSSDGLWIPIPVPIFTIPRSSQSCWIQQSG